MTIQYGENEVRHLMALKEVNAKEAPEAEMTQEEVIGFKDLDDDFVLAQAEMNAAALDKLIKDLDTSETEV